MNLYRHAENQVSSSLCFRDLVDLKILQSGWPGAFWPISQEPDFLQIWNLFKNTANNINFYYGPKSEKNFPINSENPIFGPFFGQRYYFQKIQLGHAQHYMGP